MLMQTRAEKSQMNPNDVSSKKDAWKLENMDVIPEEPVYLSQKGNEGYATPSFKSRNNFVHILDATYI